MRRVTHFLTICMLFIAVPIKGALAVSMVMCGPGHGQTSGVVVMESTAPASSHAQHGQHDHGPQHLSSLAVAGHDDHAADANHEPLGKHGAIKCSICAACCVGGAAPASTNVLVPASVGTEPPFPALVVHVAWTVIAGLERPPRTFLV